MLPAPLPVPLLIAQHIGDDFGVVFADWLSDQSPHPARYARHGENLLDTRGTVVLAPPGLHLRVEHDRLMLDDSPPLHSCKPAIDHLFASIAASPHGHCTTACLLTGMGRDGASGLRDILRAGGQTMAQDETTCVIYGMPREAVKLGAAQRVLPLLEIGNALARMIHKTEGAR
ncbi:MAG: CheB methylesterase domain-containing protein [Aquabacterium sp.]